MKRNNRLKETALTACFTSMKNKENGLIHFNEKRKEN